MARVLYGNVVMDVMGTGNLDKMKEIAREAEEQLANRQVQGYQAGGGDGGDDEGDLEGALDSLKQEIARIEGS